MRVLAIDPGYDRMGIAVIEGDPSKPVHIWSDCVLPPKGAVEMRLYTIRKAMEEAIEEYAPDIFALETLFFNKNVKTVLGVAEARGALLSVAGKNNLRVIECSPQDVKLSVTGYGAADKAAVARMIPHLIELPDKKRLDDELDAIAVGIAALSKQNSASA
jgi:crossover junction endodeoxyribonuclease RuvC